MATNGTHEESLKSADGDSIPPKWTTESTIPLYIAGQFRKTSTTFPVTSPLTSPYSPEPNKFLYNCSAAEESDILEAISAAQKAFGPWKRTKVKERRVILERAASIFASRKEEMWSAFHTETGGARAAFEFQMHLMTEILKDVTGKLAQAIEGTVPQVEEADQNSMVWREPFGVCYAIGPWNGPYPLGLRALLFPIACGNTVILKGPEISPLPYWILVSVLHQAGLPPGVLSLIFHQPQPSIAARITDFIISQPEIRKINFTGSTEIGAKIAAVSGKYLKPCVMELGGHNAAVVLEDADLERAAEGCATGSFLAHGQICMSTGRIIVQKSIVSKFKPILVAAIDRLWGRDDPITNVKLDPVCLVSEAPVQRNQRLFADALGKGANVLTGDADHTDIPLTYLRPTVLENVTDAMAIFGTESFAPTVTLYVRDTEADILELVNASDYGLSCAVFTENLRTGFRLAKEIETGAVHINSMSVHDEAALSFGGVKKSGFGRFNAMEGLREWTYTKAVTWIE